MVASVEKTTMEEGTELPKGQGLSMQDMKEVNETARAHYSTGFPLCDARMLITSFEETGEGTQSERGELPPLDSVSISSAMTDMKLTEGIL